MQALAIQTIIQKLGYEVDIINFSNEGQRRLYRPFFKCNSIKNIVKNIILIPHIKRVIHNNNCYEKFMHRNMNLSSKTFSKMGELDESEYKAIIAGSDQIWNITIDDSDDAYFLPWVKNAVKIAYAPSFGARNIIDYSNEAKKYADYLSDFDAISIRENNGKQWIYELIQREVQVVLDPTLLLDKDDYRKFINPTGNNSDEKYIFYYSPNYDSNIIELVKKISEKYQLKVICFNSKSFYVKRMNRRGMTLPPEENPSVYLNLIKNAELVITTSFHGAVFSSIFHKKFWIVKNGGMFGKDDRVITMTNMLDLNDRIIPIEYSDDFDYLSDKDYSEYEVKRKTYKTKSLEFLKRALEIV